MESLYITIPAYNEEETIGNVMEEWYRVVETHHGDGASRLVIVDDGSKDRTREMAEAFAGDHPLTVVLHKANGGHGAAVLYGYRYAINAGADYIFQTDSDGQTSAADFEKFWRKRKDCAMVIGWRRGRADGFGRAVVTRGLRLVIRVVFGTRVADANTPFRLMQREGLEKVLSYVPENSELPNAVMPAIYKRLGMRICFLTVAFGKRAGGVQSLNMKRIFGIAFRALPAFAEIEGKLPDA